MSRVLVLVEGQTEESFVKEVLTPHLAELKKLRPRDLLEARYQKFRKMAQFFQVEG